MGQFSAEKPVPPGSALSGNQQSNVPWSHEWGPVQPFTQAAAAAAGLNFVKWEFSVRARIGQPKI